MLGIQGPILDLKAREHLREQNSTEIKDHATTHHLDIVHDFLDHIDRCVSGEERPRSKAVESFYAAIMLAKKKFVRPSQSRDELPLNTHSSGMSIRGKGTLPSILASAFEGVLDEYDNTEADQIMGYIPSEKLCDLSNATPRSTRTVFIPHKSKDDVRVIHTACNGIQDRMNYHARVVRQFLHYRKSICVWDQMSGVEDIIDQFNVYRIRAGYSLDLHAATDSLDRNEQVIGYQHILRWFGYSESEIRTLSDQWLHYMSTDLLVLMPYSGKYLKHRLATGQPMGFESSVDFLNASHDIWVTALVDYCEREYGLVSRGHNILGDDFFIGFARDKDMIFPHLYKELMAELNTECNLSKGYIYNADVTGYQVPLAEFAKNLVCDGVNITPIPLGALALCDTKQGMLSLLTWYKERMKIHTIDLRFIASYFEGVEHDLVTLLCCLPVQNQFRALAWNEDRLPQFRVQDYKVLLPFSVAFIRQFYMLSIMNELNTDHDYIPMITDWHSFTKEWSYYAKMVIRGRDSLPNNKFIALLDRLELTAIAQSCALTDVARGILPYESDEDSIIDLIPSLRKIKQDDLELIMNLFDLIHRLDPMEKYQEIWSPTLSEEMIMRLTDSLDRLKLADFNPTAQRYNVQKERVTAGFDFTELIKESVRLMKLFGITDQEVNSTLEYLSGITKSNFEYVWETKTLEEELQDDDPVDIWSELGFDL